MTELTTELIRICRAFGVFERESVCCGSVTVPQCLVLQELLDAPRDMSALAAQAGASLSSMTRLVDGLERKGWVERHRPGEDRRRVVVDLTDEGREQASELREQTEAVIRMALDHIPKTKHKQVHESVRLVRQAMDQLREAGGRCCGS
ncbi:MAG: MarR family transcriptional regulator [Deltaproteobacteria bacterium]|nr:MarR family transcriptional regulator [Deltaproteobacteria bacterium]